MKNNLTNLPTSPIRPFFKEIFQKISWKRLSKESFWVLVGQAGTALAGLIGVKLLTHVLDPSEYGKLALANTIASLIGTNLFGPIGQGLGRYWSISKDRGNLDVFYAISDRLARYASLLALLMCIIGFLLFISISRKTNWAVLVILALIIGIISGNISMKIEIFTAARQRKRTALLNTSNSFLRPFIATIIIIFTIQKAEIALSGYLLASFIVFFATRQLYLKNVSRVFVSRIESFDLKIKKVFFEGLGKEIFVYSLPFLIWGIFSWIHVSCARWALQAFHGPKVVGAFAVVSLLATYPVSFGAGFLNTLLSPIAFQKAGDLTNLQKVSSANKILLIMTGLYAVLVVILIGLFTIFHQPLILLISNIHFARFSYLLPWLTLAWALFCFGQVTTSFGLLANRPQSYIKPKIISAIIAGASTFYLSKEIGPNGVVIGLGIAGFVYALWCGIIALKTLKKVIRR